MFAAATALDSVTAEVDPELDESPAYYEVEFKSGGMAYSYEINAATGVILKHEAEIDD